jgi:hypothetical protein
VGGLVDLRVGGDCQKAIGARVRDVKVVSGRFPFFVALF